MKNIFRRTHVIFLLFSLFLIGLSGQEVNIKQELIQKNLYVIDKVEASQVILRWAPTDPGLWQTANEVGYFIDRLKIPKNETEFANAKYERLNVSPIRPWPVEEWETLVEKDDNAAIGYMTIYSEQPEIQGDIFTIMKEQDDNRKKSYFYAMIAASQSSDAAKAMGLLFEDTRIEAKTRYIYRVYAAEPLGEFKMDTAMVMVNTGNVSPQYSPMGVKTVSLENKVIIEWPTAFNRELFSSFFIERADNPNGPFTALNELPLLQLESNDIPEFNKDFKFQDSIGVNYLPYYYRVIGLTHFGERSQPSKVVMGMGKDRTPPIAPKLLRADVNDDYKVEIEWKRRSFEPDFRGFIVGRSPLAEGPFTPIHNEILSPVVNNFTDESPNPKGLNFYRVSAVDTAGNVSHSLMRYALFVDTFPPEPPTGLVGSIDSSGIVTLQWAANTETDLKGYRVYFANASDHAFIQISETLLPEPYYQDTISLNTLTEEIYYRIVAVDRGFGHSDYSEMVELKRPDIIAPTSGIFTNYKVDDHGVLLEWAISSSKDAVQQKIYRNDGERTIAVGLFDMNTKQFLDRNVINGLRYEYTLEVTDDDGLVSERSKPLRIKITDAVTEDPVHNLTVQYHEEKGIVALEWAYNNLQEDLRFVIYRSTKGKGLRSYKSVLGKTFFEDYSLREQGEYTYAIMVVSEQGKSDLSELVKVNLSEND